MQNKKNIIITSSIIGLLLIIFTVVSIISSNNKSEENTPVTLPAIPQQQPEVSMEDGTPISSDDILLEKNMRHEATKAIEQHILDISPSGSHITTCSNEWYVTDKNDDFNVLARCTVSYKSGPSERLLFVARVILDDKSEETKVVDIYKPDERYTR